MRTQREFHLLLINFFGDALQVESRPTLLAAADHGSILPARSKQPAAERGADNGSGAPCQLSAPYHPPTCMHGPVQVTRLLSLNPKRGQTWKPA
jgi:hypothetical protein